MHVHMNQPQLSQQDWKMLNKWLVGGRLEDLQTLSPPFKQAVSLFLITHLQHFGLHAMPVLLQCWLLRHRISDAAWHSSLINILKHLGKGQALSPVRGASQAFCISIRSSAFAMFSCPRLPHICRAQKVLGISNRVSDHQF